MLHKVAIAAHEHAVAKAYGVDLLRHGKLHEGLALHEIHLAVVGVVVHLARIHGSRVELDEPFGKVVEQENALALCRCSQH